MGGGLVHQGIFMVIQQVGGKMPELFDVQILEEGPGSKNTPPRWTALPRNK